MKSSDRIRVIRATTAELAGLTEEQANAILSATGAPSMSGTFMFYDQARRTTALYEFLGKQPDEVIERLAGAWAPPESKVARLAAYLVSLPNAELKFLLRGAEVQLDWYRFERHDMALRQRVIMAVLGADDQLVDDIYDALSEELPETARVAPAPVASPPPEPKDVPAPPPPEAISSVDPTGPIFVVHGRAHAVLHEAVRVIEGGTSRRAVVLHEQPNAGLTILEKFEREAEKAAFAVVLVTADDEGGIAASGTSLPRGRQNVVFELGFFFGKLGRNRVAVLLEGGVEKPSDIDGLVYIALDPAGAWKYRLGRELRDAGIPFEDARVP